MGVFAWIMAGLAAEGTETKTVMIIGPRDNGE